eukprot:scaffold19017_cov193-Cylindrotheca_fusiformis.AAC.1
MKNEHAKDDFTHDDNRCNRRTWKPQPWNPAMLMVINSTVASTDTNSEGEPVIVLVYRITSTTLRRNRAIWGFAGERGMDV